MALQQWWAQSLLQSPRTTLWLLHPSMLQVGFLQPCLMHCPPAWAKFEQDACLHQCRPPFVKQNIPEPFALIQLVHQSYWHRLGNKNRSMMYYWLTNTNELPRLTGKVGSRQCRGVVGLPMMVLALVIGWGSSDNNEGCSDKINTMATMVDLIIVWCVERWLHYIFIFSRQLNIYSFCMKIQVKASRCEVGRRIIYPAKPTSTCFPIRMSRCRFGGKNNFPANPTSTCFPRRVSRCRFGGKSNSPAKPTSTRFSRRVGSCRFGRKIVLLPNLHLLIFQEDWVDVGLAGKIILPPFFMAIVFFH